MFIFRLGHEDGTFMVGLVCPYKKGKRDILLSPGPCTNEKPHEDTTEIHLSTSQRADPHLGLSSFQKCEK